MPKPRPLRSSSVQPPLCSVPTVLSFSPSPLLWVDSAWRGEIPEDGGHRGPMASWARRAMAGRASCTSFGKRLLETTKPVPWE